MRFGWDTLIGRAAKYQEHVPALFNLDIARYIGVVATALLWWEYSFIIRIPTAVEDSYDVAVVQVA